MSESPFALEITGLHKSFDRPVVKDLHLRVKAGEFYALLGPNGAGKTTILRMVAGLLQPESGAISVFGLDTRKDALAAKSIIAWVSDEPMVYDRLTPYEYLRFVAGLWQIDPAQAQARSTELIEWLGLAPPAHERCGGFSKGMLQKVALAGALVHEPKLIILDEPAAGLSTEESEDLCTLLAALRSEGIGVLLIEHHMDVIMRVCDRITVLDRGAVIAGGRPGDIQQDAQVRLAYLGTKSTVPDLRRESPRQAQ